MWTYSLRRGGTYLHSLGCMGIRSCPWESAGSDWVLASCNREPHGQHRAPDEDCTCGVYAFTKVRDLFQFGLPYEFGDGDGALVGRVELAGKIIEHDNGYRSERARIAELVPIEGTTEDAMRIGQRLGISVSPIAPVSAELSEVDIQVLEMIASGSTISEVGAVLSTSSREADDRLLLVLITLAQHEKRSRFDPWPQLGRCLKSIMRPLP